MSEPVPAEARDGLELLVDPRTGVIKQLIQLRAESSHPAFFHAAAEAANVGAFTPQTNFVYSGGASVTAGGAVLKAVGEAIERYSAALYDRREMPFCAAAAAEFACVPPAQFAVHAGDQFGAAGFDLAPFDDAVPVHWTVVFDPLTGDRAHAPAAAVFLPWSFFTEAGEAAILQPVSTGLACHGSFEAAASGALCEVAERDAFTLVWQARLAPPRLDRASLGDDHRDLLARMERAGYAVELFSIGNDVGIAVVMAVARHDQPAAPALVVAAAAAAAPGEAARKALEELPHTARYMTALKAERADAAAALTPDGVTGQDDHLLFWADPSRRPGADFLLANPASVPLDSLPDHRAATPAAELDRLCRAVRNAGHRVWLRDLTTPDVALAGFHVARALAPGLHPLMFGHARRALGGRLGTAAQRLGWPADLPAGARDNPLPHPFP